MTTDTDARGAGDLLSAEPAYQSGAVISVCGRYRYRLWRIWDDCRPIMAFCMCNPSTADANTDDATIRRCIGYAKREKHGGIVVVNVFAFRSRFPADLLTAEDPVGPENLAYLSTTRNNLVLSTMVAAFGKRVGNKRFRDRYCEASIALCEQKAKCLGTNLDGTPKHPLYVAADAPLIPWRMPSW